MKITFELVIIKHHACGELKFSSMQEVYDHKALEEEGFDRGEFLKSRRMKCGTNAIIHEVGNDTN